MTPDWTHDDDLHAALMPPGWLYTDPSAQERLLKSAFSGAWHMGPSASEVRDNDCQVPWTLGRGSLNEPVLTTRDSSGVVRCLSNICTHRAAKMVSTPCKGSKIRCPYHGRRFDLSGQFSSAPGFAGARNFPRPEDSLTSLPHHLWGSMSFASLAPWAAFEDWKAPFMPFLDPMVQRSAVEDAGSRTSYLVESNWLLYIENYLEGLHIPFIHPGLTAALDLKHYEVFALPGAVMQVGFAKPGEPSIQMPTGSPFHDRPVAAWYLFVFPNLMINVYPWGLSVNIVEPVTLQSCRVVYRSFVADDTLRGLGAGGDVHAVEREDQEVVQRVQHGIGSALWPRGRYAPTHELGVHHFHRMLHRCWKGDTPLIG